MLPETLPYFPRQFGRCAVIGNSGDLLKTKFGKEIDTYDAVLRENGAPIQVNIESFLSNFQLLLFPLLSHLHFLGIDFLFPLVSILI